MLLGQSLPEWLQDGAHYGLEGVKLELDNCLVRLPRLKESFRSWRKFGSKPSEAEEIHQQAKVLNHNLLQWAAALPPDWAPRSCTDLDDYDTQNATQRVLSLDGTAFPNMQTHTDFEHSVSWNLYRAARLVVLEIMQTTEPAADVTQAHLLVAESIKLIDDICASVPYHFHCAGLPSCNSGSRQIVPQVGALRVRAVGPLIVPLIIALCRIVTPKDTRLWLKQQLMVIGEVVCNKSIRQFVEHI